MASTSRPKPTKKFSASDAALTLGSTNASAASQEEIARRAFQLYLARGGEHGYDLDDWLRAERELTVAQARPVTRGGRRVTPKN